MPTKPAAKPQKKTLSRAESKKSVAKKTSVSGRKTVKKTVGVRKKSPSVETKSSKTVPITRYKCRVCGYVYSPVRGEPHNGIPRGTAFEDLPESYVCPVCGYQGKGKVGKWGFDEWRPTKYICSICGYVYDEKRGEPHRGIRPGTKFEDLPDDYRCPVCALDPKITKSFGNVVKQGFEALDTA